MAIILGKKLVTIQNRKGTNVFQGTEEELIQLIKDTQSIADSIREDLKAGNIDAKNDSIAIEEYEEFANKY
jgi:hypothetical protein